MIHEGRKDGGEQSHGEAVLIGGYEGEEIDGQKNESSLRKKMTQLRQDDVAYHESEFARR